MPTENSARFRIFQVPLFVLLLATLYVVVASCRIGTWPPVVEDEPWIAAAPVKLATQGIYGSDLFAGYYGSEQTLYHLNPLYPLMLAADFRLAGVGAVQMRALPLSFGLLLLMAVFAVGRQLFDDQVAVVATTLLLLLRLTAPDIGSGIPLLDIARISRPDIAVPVFGLLAFIFFNRGERKGGWRDYFVSGLMIGLASICHLYGAFWLPALLVVLAIRRGGTAIREGRTYGLLAGFALIWIPVLWWIASGWEQFLGQSKLVADRFDVLSPAFYLGNVLTEFKRYGALRLFHGNGVADLIRPGAWVTVAGAPLCLISLILRRKITRSDPGFTLGVILLVQAMLFALLLRVKFFNYFIALWPLLALMLAWGCVQIWRRSHRSRSLVVILMVAIVIEGAIRIAAEYSAAGSATPYDVFESRIGAMIPPGSRLLGLPQYWLGLREHDYRSWLLPILMTEPGGGLPLDSAISRVAPDVVLIDRHMRDFLDETSPGSSPRHGLFEGYRRFMQNHRGVLLGNVADSTYGVMEIYGVRR